LVIVTIILDYTIGVVVVKACGLVVEYNPFHHGHYYHVHKTKQITNADCIIAVMSGSFLQRGEPAIIDKFHRTKAALEKGVDIVLELPYPYAVQSSTLFAKGAIYSLYEIGVSEICFGSESGNIADFIDSYNFLKKHQVKYDTNMYRFLNKGYSFPLASSKAFEIIGMKQVDMVQPNNILGFSYVKTILENRLPIKPRTIKRIKNHYHEKAITNKIASATSIRKELINNDWSQTVGQTLPKSSVQQLKKYKSITNQWHTWESYFPYLHYRVISMSTEELAQIHGVDEGLENRIKKTAIKAKSFQHWMEQIKTKRYTEIRLQRMFTHILTNTTKKEMEPFLNMQSVPYLRLIGMSETGQAYLNHYKKEIQLPLISSLKNKFRSLLYTDEKAMNVYYSILPSEQREKLRKQEFQLPIIL